MAAGGGMVYYTQNKALRRKKIIPYRHFLWFKGDLKSQWIQKFYLCDESNPINPRCRKISANFCISPPHPPHPQFYPQQRWKFRDTSWLTKKNGKTIDLRGAQERRSTSNGSWRQGIKGEMTCTVYVALVWNIIYWIIMIIIIIIIMMMMMMMMIWWWWWWW